MILKISRISKISKIAILLSIFLLASIISNIKLYSKQECLSSYITSKIIVSDFNRMRNISGSVLPMLKSVVKAKSMTRIEFEALRLSFSSIVEDADELRHLAFSLEKPNVISPISAGKDVDARNFFTYLYDSHKLQPSDNCRLTEKELIYINNVVKYIQKINQVLQTNYKNYHLSGTEWIELLNSLTQISTKDWFES